MGWDNESAGLKLAHSKCRTSKRIAESRLALGQNICKLQRSHPLSNNATFNFNAQRSSLESWEVAWDRLCQALMLSCLNLLVSRSKLNSIILGREMRPHFFSIFLTCKDVRLLRLFLFLLSQSILKDVVSLIPLKTAMCVAEANKVKRRNATNI